jgi:hypothetical protein
MKTVPVAPAMDEFGVIFYAMLIEKWPSYYTLMHWPSRQDLILKDPPEIKDGATHETWAVSLSYPEDLQQVEFWDIYIEKYGAEALALYPQIIGVKMTYKTAGMGFMRGREYDEYVASIDQAVSSADPSSSRLSHSQKMAEAKEMLWRLASEEKYVKPETLGMIEIGSDAVMQDWEDIKAQDSQGQSPVEAFRKERIMRARQQAAKLKNIMNVESKYPKVA